MLCKNIVARNIVRDLEKYDFSLSDIKMLTFNAADVFNVNCEACLLLLKLWNEKKLTCDVYEFDAPERIKRSFGWINNNFMSDIANYSVGSSIDGLSPFEWRQGIKHDCSKIMELNITDGVFVNGYKETLSIEDNLIYPLLKSSDLKRYVIQETRKHVIVTQRKVKEPTDYIETQHPKTWEYLTSHGQFLDGRKSSIYKKSPRFSIFGIGPYSFMPYKVAISGFYKNPIFSLVYNSKPVMLDDTCYFLSFNNYDYALMTMLLLNHPVVQGFIKSIAFLDSKRPYTKEILMRIDLLKVSELVGYDQLISFAKRLNIQNELSNTDYDNYKDHIKNTSSEKSA